MEGTACCYVPEGIKPGNFFMLLDAGLKACSTLALGVAPRLAVLGWTGEGARAHMNCGNVELCLAFQVGVDPAFDFLAAVVGGVEADAESLTLMPSHNAADVDARQSEQGKGNLDVGA